jgi:hypothetical protein
MTLMTNGFHIEQQLMVTDKSRSSLETCSS